MIPRLLPSLGGVTVGNKTGTDEEKHAGPDGVQAATCVPMPES